MSFEQFGRRLAELRKKRGLTQEQLAEKLGVHVTHIAKIEIGLRLPSVQLLKKISEVLDASLDDLFGIPKIRVENIHWLNEEDYKMIPVFEGVAAGSGRIPDGTPVDFMPIPKSWRGTYAVVVYGDSMEPEFYEGDRVIVNPYASFESGDRVVVIFDDGDEAKAVVKIFRRQNGMVFLESLNKNYPPIVVTPQMDLLFVGKVIGLFRRY